MQELTFQVFIVPKGEFLKGLDKWKEDFLIEILNKSDVIEIHTNSYLITGVSFYNFSDETSHHKKLFKTQEHDYGEFHVLPLKNNKL